MKTESLRRWHAASLAAVLLVSMAIVARAETLPSSGTAKSDKLTAVALDKVKVCGEFGRRIGATVENSLLNLDVDNVFLKQFREKKTTSGYTGLGLLIDATVRLAVYTGDPRLLARKNHLVKTLIDAQEPDGYLGEFDKTHRLWEFVDIQELAYLMQALLTDYRHFHDERSLTAAKKQADYILKHWHEKPADWPLKLTISGISTGGLPQQETKTGVTLHMMTTGLERAMYSLFEYTGDSKYRDFSVKEMGVTSWDFPIVLFRQPPFEGHIYAYMSRCLAQLDWYRHDPAPALLASTRRALDFMLHGNGMVVTGGCSDHECWHNTQTGTVNLTETCGLVYILKLLNNLMQLEGDSLYGDVMERAIYNQLFSAQSPDGRKIRYYTAFDGPRSYFPNDIYCCPNNYRRAMSDLPGLIFYQHGNGVAVNLYTASSARVKLDKGVQVSIAQETDYPNSGTVRLRIDPDLASEFSVSLRIPRWCAASTISVNGEPVRDAVRSGTFHAIRRTWKQGDRIELRMPMPWRFVRGRQAQVGKVAILRGPVVFGMAPSRDKRLTGMSPATITLDTTSIKGPLPDSAVRPDGMACKIGAWKPGSWYDQEKPNLQLHLTELPDPAIEAIYFHVPNPLVKEISDDELFDETNK